jgi:hypothetical protein
MASGKGTVPAGEVRTRSCVMPVGDAFEMKGEEEEEEEALEHVPR